MKAMTKEFARQLRGGGTVAVYFYGRPRVRGHGAAEEVLARISGVWERENLRGGDEVTVRG